MILSEREKYLTCKRLEIEADLERRRNELDASNKLVAFEIEEKTKRHKNELAAKDKMHAYEMALQEAKQKDNRTIEEKKLENDARGFFRRWW